MSQAGKTRSTPKRGGTPGSRSACASVLPGVIPWAARPPVRQPGTLRPCRRLSLLAYPERQAFGAEVRPPLLCRSNRTPHAPDSPAGFPRLWRLTGSLSVDWQLAPIAAMRQPVFAKSTVSSQNFWLFPLPSPDLSQAHPQRRGYRRPSGAHFRCPPRHAWGSPFPFSGRSLGAESLGGSSTPR